MHSKSFSKHYTLNYKLIVSYKYIDIFIKQNVFYIDINI